MYSLDQIMTNMAASPYFNLQPMTEAEYAAIVAQENAKTQEALRTLAANDPEGFARLQASGWQSTPFPTVTEANYGELNPETAALLRSMNINLYSGLPGGWSGNQLASAQSGMASEAERAGRGDSLFSKVVNYGLPIAGMLSGQPWLAAAGGFASGADEGLGSALTGAALAGGASYATPYLKGMLPDVSGSMPSWLTDAASSAGDLFSGAPGATEGATTYPYVDPGAVAGTALDAGGMGLADYSLASGADGLGLTAGGGLGLTAESLPFAGTGGLGLTAPAFGGGTITAGGLGIPLTAGAAGALGTGGAASGMTVPGSGASATSAGGAAGTTGAAGTVGMGSGFKIPGTDITVPWSLAGTALGALAGGLGGASEAGTTTSITDLPPWQKNLVIPGMQDAARIYGTLPEGVDPSMTMGRDYLMSTIGGNYLQNPYEQAVADALGADASKAVAGQFELGGRYGSPGMAEATARGVVNAIAPYRYNTYAQERARQQQAALAAPDYSGAFITQPLLKSKAYMDIIGRPFGSSKTEPYFENRTASIIGGGLLGSRLFS